MSKRRKYDGKNKRSFIIIIILAIIIVGIFSLFIYLFSKASKIEYVIKSGSVLQDVEKNYFILDDDALLKIRWNGNYYLVYNDEKITLGKKVIVYNTITGGMNLYGTFYEILEDGKVIEHRNETILENTTNAKFYKIDDREYLLVDTKIYSEDYSIEANSYLLVELDKMGNAKLSNNKINLKTISPTVLLTSKYSFDIANEILNFGKFDIDLKKVIGSTNQYNPDGDKSGDKGGNGKDNETSATSTGSGGGSGGGSGVGTGNGTGTGNVINNVPGGTVTEMDDLLDKVKMTSIIRIIEGLNSIDIDYVIYDPYNEYSAVYVEVVSEGKIDVVYLSKNDTHVSINNLDADTKYKLKFIYTTSVTDPATGELKTVPNTFEQFELKTLKPSYSISIYKISKVYNTLTYKVDLQKNFSTSKVNVNMSFEYEEADVDTGLMVKKIASLDSSVDISENTSNSVYGTFDISGYDISADTIIKLTIKSIITNGVELSINETYSFRFGR